MNLVIFLITFSPFLMFMFRCQSMILSQSKYDIAGEESKPKVHKETELDVKHEMHLKEALPDQFCCFVLFSNNTHTFLYIMLLIYLLFLMAHL